MTEQNRALRIGVITAAVVGAVAIPATAFAANSSGLGRHSAVGTTTAMHAPVRGGEDFAGPAHGRGGQSGEHLTALAAALGTTPEALKEAMQAAREETKPATRPTTAEERQAHQNAYLAALAGKLNVTVDALKAAMEANKPAGKPGGPGFAGRKGGPVGGPGVAALATALNTTPDALQAAMRAAHEETKPDAKPTDEAARQALRDAYLAALAGKLNVSVDALKTALEANKPAKPARPTAEQQRTMLEPRLTQMVTSGKITQAQADQILADLDAGKPVFEALKQVMPGLGGEHGRGPGGERGPRGPQGNGA